MTLALLATTLPGVLPMLTPEEALLGRAASFDNGYSLKNSGSPPNQLPPPVPARLKMWSRSSR
jgi:hypothetical protein